MIIKDLSNIDSANRKRQSCVTRNQISEVRFKAIKDVIDNAYYDLLQMEEMGCIVPPVKPDYPNEYADYWNQACYVLRYIYAYSYEYFRMYLDMFSNEVLGRYINVLSLGCGTMVDAWSLQEAIRFRRKNTAVSYIGVDMNRWGNNYEPKVAPSIIKKHMHKRKAGDYLINQSILDFDILVFPKSIGDIYRDPDDFEKIVYALKTKDVKKDSFYIAFSFVNYKDEKNMDAPKIDKIISSLSLRGYRLKKEKHKSTDQAIVASNPGFPPLDNQIVMNAKRLTGKEVMRKRIHEKYYYYRFEK